MAAATSAQLHFLTDAAHLMRQAAPGTSAYLMSRRIDIASASQAAAVAAGTAPIAALPHTDVQRQHVCTSCGLILVPGSDGTTLAIQSGRPTAKNRKARRLEAERKRKQKQTRDENTTVSEKPKPPHAPVAHAGITKVYTCGLCSRETRIALPPPPPLSKQRKPKAAAKAKAEDAKLASEPNTTSAERKAPPTPAAAPPASVSTSTTVATTTAAKASNANSKKRAKNRKAGLLALLDKSRATESGMGLNFTFDDFRMK
ncbi:hypothetical protein SCUCBS95973_006577 [Sporothrix curviconia]|uniref:Uncharacterized protein n=1 Tax=Sporothrix curviconia TaxID=1260050 RepID=A0ABP0C6A8_9PEZI